MLKSIISWSYVNNVFKNKNVIYSPFRLANPHKIVGSTNLNYCKILTHDTIRMSAYRDAIHKTVKDKVVVEIGTGAYAPLAKMCHDAGAKHIYAIEGNQQALQHAEKLLKKEGKLDKITLINGMSYEIDLPEKADVLVHEIIGSLGSNEGMVSAALDAKQRLLKPEAQFIPQQCQVVMGPIQRPYCKHPYYIFDFFLYKSIMRPAYYGIHNCPESALLAPPQVFEDKDFTQQLQLEAQSECRFTIQQSGRLDGLLLWCKIAVSEQHQINTLQGTSWPGVFIPLFKKGLKVEVGDKLVVNSTQDLTERPQYTFDVVLERNGKKTALDPIKIGFDEKT